MLKITVVPKEVTRTFLSDYMWFTTTAKLCEVILVITFAFDYFDKFESASKWIKLNESPNSTSHSKCYLRNYEKSPLRTLKRE